MWLDCSTVSNQAKSDQTVVCTLNSKGDRQLTTWPTDSVLKNKYTQSRRGKRSMPWCSWVHQMYYSNLAAANIQLNFTNNIPLLFPASSSIQAKKNLRHSFQEMTWLSSDFLIKSGQDPADVHLWDCLPARYSVKPLYLVLYHLMTYKQAKIGSWKFSMSLVAHSAVYSPSEFQGTHSILDSMLIISHNL